MGRVSGKYGKAGVSRAMAPVETVSTWGRGLGDGLTSALTSTVGACQVEKCM